MQQEELRWQRDGAHLRLQGALVCDALGEFWRQRQTLLQGVDCLDISGVTRVDSAGLALLLHAQNLYPGTPIPLRGVSERLHTLIALYNLREIVLCERDVS
ncbi:anti-sigma B factor antagonist [Edwardsiella hoshinae]|uniref:Anti-sigma B factor antagonist n=1 Tax=Edwardsiella hoshinae TaxID=93378 RepID=A0ABM6ENH0_9GAMM|nr:anti-sigma B factor antagonist [Edwardsiella hoshinae]